MASSMSNEAYKSLVEMIGRAFYDDNTLQRSRSGNDNHGICVVVLDFFASNPEWFNVVEIAKRLKLSKLQVQEALGFLEDEKLLKRVQKKGGQTFCYALDYGQIYTVISYKLLKMKDMFETTVDGYICTMCCKRYSALDATSLVSEDQHNFVCEVCKVELVSETDRLKILRDKFEDQLQVLMQQLEREQNLPPPELKNPQRTKRDRDGP